MESFAASYVYTYLHFSTPKIVGNLGAFFDRECKIPLLKVEYTSQEMYEYRSIKYPVCQLSIEKISYDTASNSIHSNCFLLSDGKKFACTQPS